MYIDNEITNEIDIELAAPGHANGISTQLAEKQALYGPDVSLNPEEKTVIIQEAAQKFGEFLTALGVDWQNDPHARETPLRVAKAYVVDLWRGRYEHLPQMTTFPNEGYDGIIFQGGISLTAMCAHHHQAITGIAHVGYIPSEQGRIVGLSKLNRVVEHFARRGVIQEQLTIAIHHAINSICVNNRGVAVVIAAAHHCVKCRGVKHQHACMKTYKFSGMFEQASSPQRTEFYEFIKNQINT